MKRGRIWEWGRNLIYIFLLASSALTACYGGSIRLADLKFILSYL